MKDIIDIFFLTKKYFEITKYERAINESLGNRVQLIHKSVSEIIETKLKGGTSTLHEFSRQKLNQDN